MNDNQIDELIDRTLREDQTLPEGLSERLEQKIDSWATAGKKETAHPSFRKRMLYRLSAIAAILLLCIGITLISGLILSNRQPADTYSDPREAAIVAQEALIQVSKNLNKGINRINDVQIALNNVNIIHE